MRFGRLLAIATALVSIPAAAAAEADLGGSVGFEWQSHIELSEVPVVGWGGESFGSPYYADIMAHAQRKITGYSAMTNAHETNHMLNAEVRNRTPANDSTIYLEDGKAAMVLEPRMSSTLIRNYVPAFVKQKASSRYQSYVINQTAHWPNVLYQFDEWSAYRTDGRVAMEVHRAGNFGRASQNEICVNDGAIEFLYFASAAVQGLSVNEPDYLRDNLQFKVVFAMLAEQTMDYYKYGKGDRNFDCQGTEILNHFVSSPDNSAIRLTLKNWIGPDWTARVFGF